jgi:hypothetical protein
MKVKSKFNVIFEDIMSNVIFEDMEYTLIVRKVIKDFVGCSDVEAEQISTCLPTTSEYIDCFNLGLVTPESTKEAEENKSTTVIINLETFNCVDDDELMEIIESETVYDNLISAFTEAGFIVKEIGWKF